MPKDLRARVLELSRICKEPFDTLSREKADDLLTDALTVYAPHSTYYFLVGLLWCEDNCEVRALEECKSENNDVQNWSTLLQACLVLKNDGDSLSHDWEKQDIRLVYEWIQRVNPVDLSAEAVQSWKERAEAEGSA